MRASLISARHLRERGQSKASVGPRTRNNSRPTYRNWAAAPNQTALLKQRQHDARRAAHDTFAPPTPTPADGARPAHAITNNNVHNTPERFAPNAVVEGWAAQASTGAAGAPSFPHGLSLAHAHTNSRARAHRVQRPRQRHRSQQDTNGGDAQDGSAAEPGRWLLTQALRPPPDKAQAMHDAQLSPVSCQRGRGERRYGTGGGPKSHGSLQQRHNGEGVWARSARSARRRSAVAEDEPLETWRERPELVRFVPSAAAEDRWHMRSARSCASSSHISFQSENGCSTTDTVDLTQHWGERERQYAQQRRSRQARAHTREQLMMRRKHSAQNYNTALYGQPTMHIAAFHRQHPITDFDVFNHTAFQPVPCSPQRVRATSYLCGRT